jgi:hypothetical protein
MWIFDLLFDAIMPAERLNPLTRSQGRSLSESWEFKKVETIVPSGTWNPLSIVKIRFMV